LSVGSDDPHDHGTPLSWVGVGRYLEWDGSRSTGVTKSFGFG
jgi:hypothetical protein